MIRKVYNITAIPTAVLMLWQAQRRAIEWHYQGLIKFAVLTRADQNIMARITQLLAVTQFCVAL
ncbi:hypothetical protein AYI95_07600 [Shewanella xiamenensis]|nr:hypothetical protein AYI95_07600 [Shewanella xiamenensis]